MSNQIIGAPSPIYGNAFQTPPPSNQASPNHVANPNQPGRITGYPVNGNYIPVTPATGEYGGSNSFPSIEQRAFQAVPTSQPGNVRVTHTKTVCQETVQVDLTPEEAKQYYADFYQQLPTPVHTYCYASFPVVPNPQFNTLAPLPSPPWTPTSTPPLGQQGQGQVVTTYASTHFIPAPQNTFPSSGR
ncbi:hypothetical protein [Endozoicomonas elysicola]|uniref:Uncharacterized protein n=1 Tax=Endozoicomonas elysicola TaxID=305900 RepID=A0A081K7F4_9GAMM|nr:hypothetical protein [Endozoicomonas elysicola]KEI70080.1 hypothetical protein GV64_04365 [Endozoicomonas elysicola]